MIEPQGPLPPEIYWRRRVVAGGAALVVVGLVVALIVWMTSGGDAPQNTAATSSVPSSAAPSSESAPPSSEPPAAGDAGAGGAPGGNAAGAGAPGGASASASSPPESASPAGVPGGPAGPNLCPDQAISVVLYTDKPTYTIGQQPVFTIVTTNAGLSDCTRDVGKAAQNVIVRTLDGSRTLWSARDCSPIETVNNVVLKPAQQVKDTITWSGTTSSPGCERPRTQVPAGSYSAIGKIGERESFPITFNVVAPAQEP
ncbi:MULTISPECIES: hypothetical protein [Gordonia]|uniref:Uncharacterized protein n=2 Tax=Gordonia alkanivorans TaxID=84096 RepID=F9VUR7_9ACTN|nr:MULTISPECIES: hypothetical protein [Gordonia]AZZ83462.1 hypothetical protein C5O27_00590 [Gordonia alkanivorans]ETA05743.1 hypothetical protein V525_15915 [Gordonia alkanivorans CGMCC 6845]MDH3005757.1 hypothetical protein [Gordonia alkanivorans]MDH3011129.1 hypothetical protein [Gordonia alkanivorans]MDH3016050.1 hypothetical protein [Gordonia alkanivorans]